MSPAKRGRVESGQAHHKRQQRAGWNVVWLTALVIVPIVVAELQARRLPDAPEIAAAPIVSAHGSLVQPAPILSSSAFVAIAALNPPLARQVALVVPDVKRAPSRVEPPAPGELAYTNGVVHGDLYAAAYAAGVPPTALAAMIRGFSYDVDFQREVREGDSFEVAYDRGTGSLRFAALTLAGKRRVIYRYKDDWFDETGAGVRKPLLRTPVDGGRLTSGYGSRYHPLLGYTTAHRGIDFGA